MPFPLSYRQKSWSKADIVMTGAEQTLIESTKDRSQIEGYLDLSNMQAGDTIYVRQYMKLSSTSTYVSYGEMPLSDAQAPINLLRFVSVPNVAGVKITVQQTAGGMRTFSYAWFEEQRNG